MESANLKVTDEVVVGSNPSNLGDPTPNCFSFGTTNHHAWSSSSSSSTPNFSNCNQKYDIGMVSISNSPTSTSQKSSEIDQNNNIANLAQSDHSTHNHNNVLVHDLLGFPWNHSTNQSSYDIQVAKFKEEFSESLPRFTELLNSPSSSNIDDYGRFLLASHIKNNDNNRDLFRSDSSCSSTTTDQNLLMVKACQINGRDRDNNDDQISGAEFDGQRRGQFSQIYPSVNISNLNHQHDHLASARFMGSDHHHRALNDNINLAVLRDDNFGLVQMQQPHDRLACGRGNNQVISSMSSEMMELAKRSSTFAETKLSNQLTANKKSRSESRTSYPPFKVRKEKLGDRIAALQQLVSPFGKTDTASVLMEAIGYIKFLQSQVETLSVPYMKSSRNKSTKTIQGGLKDEGNEETKRDMRSRGLCLVPLSCMSYVTGDHSGDGSIWPPNFCGRT